MTAVMTVLTGLLWLTCALIVALVLLQTGKGGGMAGLFGGGAGPESLLGTRATSFLVKVTAVLGVIFLVLCLALNSMSKRALSTSKYQTIPAPGAVETDVTPAEMNAPAPAAPSPATGSETPPAETDAAAPAPAPAAAPQEPAGEKN